MVSGLFFGLIVGTQYTKKVCQKSLYVGTTDEGQHDKKINDTYRQDRQ